MEDREGGWDIDDPRAAAIVLYSRDANVVGVGWNEFYNDVRASSLHLTDKIKLTSTVSSHQ